jgi:bifunctional non-homologous end joining protein LigD
MATKRAQLDRYREKRTFTRTPEPGPKLASGRRGPLMFVIQKHAASRLHYDFRLELDGVLKSWAVPKGPSASPADKRMAVEVEDHPFDYGSFEGVIPEKQYGAGNVIVWDCGVYSPDEDDEYSFDDRREAEKRVRAELKAGKLSLFMRGEKVKGSYTLVRTRTTKQWLLIKHRDRFAQSNDLLARARSVLSGYTVEEISPEAKLERLDAERLAPAGAPETMPKTLAPMLAEIGESAKTNGAWRYEPKLDGYRVIAFVEDGDVRLQSRRGLDLTDAFPELTAELAQQAVEHMILDGEIIAYGPDGRQSFNALQNRVQLKTGKEIAAAQRETPVAYVCFDLLHFAGLNLRNEPYVDRRRWLSQCLLPGPHVQLVHASDDAERLYEASIASGFEGIVAKRKNSTYIPGKRTNAWLKIKAVNSSEFVVGGYTQGKGARDALGALLLGYWHGSKLKYVGHVGSGLTEASYKDLQQRVKALVRKTSPFDAKVDLHRPTTWVEPKLVAEVNFSGWTPTGNLRAPVFLRIRDDVPSRTIRSGPQAGAEAGKIAKPKDDIDEVLQQLENPAKRLDISVGGAKVSLTNLDRVYWPADKAARHPEITKRDLIRYLARVSPYILPHLKDRPLTMIRMPEGINGERFFQKHWGQAKPEYIEKVTVWSGSKDERHDYLLANNLPSLLWLGQVGTLEFHVWHSHATVEDDAASKSTDFASSLETLESSVLNYPDFLVFDIDPYIYSGKEAKGAEPELNKKGFAMGRRVAFWLRDLLKEMSLEAVIKTSGKTGLHLFVPIERTVTFDEVRTICETVGRHLLREHPKDITMEWATQKRTGKIFIDYNMNVRGKTLNSAYSPRGVSGAPVSMPLSWEELEAAEPMDFTITNTPDRLDKTGDRWHDIDQVKQSLTKAFGSNRRKES